MFCVLAITLRRNFGALLDKKRAEGRADLRKCQRKLAKTNSVMAIFLGKNELDQKDSKDFNLGGIVEIILEDE